MSSLASKKFIIQAECLYHQEPASFRTVFEQRAPGMIHISLHQSNHIFDIFSNELPAEKSFH